MPSKGFIKNNTTGGVLSFQYNPDKFSYSRGVTYNEIGAPGSAYPIIAFVHGKVRTFDIELFIFDKPSTGLFIKTINFLGGFLTPETNVAGYTKPPTMMFCYGYFIRKCVLDNLDISIEEMDSNGKPINGRVTLTLRQVSP